MKSNFFYMFYRGSGGLNSMFFEVISVAQNSAEKHVILKYLYYDFQIAEICPRQLSQETAETTGYSFRLNSRNYSISIDNYDTTVYKNNVQHI